MTKKNSILIITVLACGLFMQSCTIAKISGKGAVPILLNQPSQQMQLVEHITLKKNSNFDWTSSFDVSEIIAKKVAEKQPDALINTTITIKTGIDNYLINLFTLGLARSRKIVVDADLMKEKK
ncbi:MAG: hypothetical protein O3B82_00065 [Bacteroidetes bacterium]|nr:hypothetical protein [Bacteroidota bacterium]